MNGGMSSDFRAEPSMAGLVGTVTYRCAGCGQPIKGDRVAFVSPTYTLIGSLPHGLELTEQTRTYHPEHTPKE